MRYVVCGVDDDGLTELNEYDDRRAAISFVDGYTRRLDDDGLAGGWSLIEVYDRDMAEDLAECVCYRWEAMPDEDRADELVSRRREQRDLTGK